MKKLRLSTLYSQRDPRHKDIMLGHNAQGSQYTIGNFGCLITVICAYLNALGINITVAELNDKLKQNGGYQNGGLFVFNSLKNIWPDITADYISAKWNGPVPDADIKKMYELLDAGKPLVTEVDFYPNTVMEDMHWVLIYGYDENGNFLIFDPWTGNLVPLSVYGEPKRVIYCYRTYTKILAFDGVEPVVCHPKTKNEELIRKSTGYDDITTYLEYPLDTSPDKLKSTIAGHKSRSTDLQKQLDVASAEVKNREEQVGRLKDQVLQSEVREKALINQLKNASENSAETVKVIQGQLKEQQALIDTYGKQKGALVTENTQLKSQLAKTKDELVKSLSVWDVLVLAGRKLVPFLQSVKLDK